MPAHYPYPGRRLNPLTPPPTNPYRKATPTLSPPDYDYASRVVAWWFLNLPENADVMTNSMPAWAREGFSAFVSAPPSVLRKDRYHVYAHIGEEGKLLRSLVSAVDEANEDVGWVWSMEFGRARLRRVVEGVYGLKRLEGWLRNGGKVVVWAERCGGCTICNLEAEEEVGGGASAGDEVKGPGEEREIGDV